MSVMSRLIAGAMSGTSADGVDVALVRVEGAGLGMTAHLLRHHYRTYDPALRRAIFSVRDTASTSLADLANLAREISLTYAAAVNQALAAEGITASDVAAVAAHGQTLYHAPPNTIQWLDPALLAAQTKCAVVSDFRRADCAAGGQGAPLVPFADYLLFRHPKKSRVLLNIGGIANLTYLPAGADIDHLIAFDTGPGNCISDWLCRKFDPTGPGYDPGGERAARGQPLMSVFCSAFEHPYFRQPPPRSTDGPAMIQTFQRALDRHNISPGARHVSLDDLFATSAYLTARAVSGALELLRIEDAEVIASGGGTQNKAIMHWLQLAIQDLNGPLRRSEELGVPSEAKEALAFALLAAATLDNQPSNIPSCTGANCRVVLGSITPKP